MSQLTAAQKKPVDIAVDMKGREVRITWQDGLESRYPFDYLRKICPCATCNELRKEDDPLRVFKPDQMSAVAELRPGNPVEMVGNYALQFFWTDGHNTGIYGFDFLRKKSPQ